MRKRKNLYGGIILLFIGIFVFIACNKEDQRKEEEEIKLQQYLQEKGYSSIEPTSSGLYHVVLAEGTGDAPERSDYIIFEFTGSLIDGTIFDTSDRSLAVLNNILKEDKLYGPLKISMAEMGITGLREGLMLMKEKGFSRFIIPSRLAFGSSDLGIIPPYSTLIYDIELLNVISDPEEHEQNILDQYIEANNISVTPTESGLFYVETKLGEGDLPADNSEVTLHYKGYLLDGRIFDESETGEPAIFYLNNPNIIPGLIEGVKKMRKGGEASLIIPWSAAFGAEGSGDGIIPPYTTVIFDIRLLDIK